MQVRIYAERYQFLVSCVPWCNTFVKIDVEFWCSLYKEYRGGDIDSAYGMMYPKS